MIKFHLLVLSSFFSIGCLSQGSNSQVLQELEYFLTVKNNNDSTLKYFMTFLERFDSTESYRTFFSEKACERVGDYYKSKKNYVKAIAYYDSAETKYRDRDQFCGNAYYIDFIPRRYKVSECYLGMNDLKQAINVLTPHIFDDFGCRYFDSSMTAYYVSLLKQFYSKYEIQNELKKVIDDIRLNYRCIFYNQYLTVISKTKIFDTEIELRGSSTSTVGGKEIPVQDRKDIVIRRFKEGKVYRLLQ